MSMNGIDIASYQAGINLYVVPCDFVIVKATEGTGYVNPDFDRAYDQAVAAGKKVGIYHYANGASGATAEADYFLYWIGDRVGNAILVLDWEQGGNSAFYNPAYAKAWLDHVYSKTGVRPLIYMSKSVCRQFDWSAVAPNYGLWVAQYANNNPTGYQSNPWTDNGGMGAWSNAAIFQYSSTGWLSGWNGNLDLNLAYMDVEAWDKYAQGDNYGGDTNVPTAEGDDDMAIKDTPEWKWLETLYANAQKTEASNWALAAMQQAVANGVTDGQRPQAPATREEVAIMIDRTLNKNKQA